MTQSASALTPVIVGIGEIIERPEPGKVGTEPLELMREAILRANMDSGANLLGQLDSLDVICQLGWSYRNLPHQLAEALGLKAVKANESPVGGNMPTKLMVDVGNKIASGELKCAVICGGESAQSLATAKQTEQTPAWTPAEKPENPRENVVKLLEPLALEYGLRMPIDVYPLYDNACRAAWNQSHSVYQQESGIIGAEMSKVAAQNPYAWKPQAVSPEKITTPGPGNRLTMHPYTKLMVANPIVNQAAAFIITSLELARAAGVPDQKMVYIGSGACGMEPRDFMARSRYDYAPAMEAVLKEVLALNELNPEELDLVELYSCFPIVPKLARRSLRLPDDLPLSVTGGLAFFGGPANNYMTHAICSMTRALRNGQGRNGLLYGNGEFLTKHHAAVISAVPIKRLVENRDLQKEINANYPGVPQLLAQYEGPSILETFTLKYDRDGQPAYAVVVARTPDNHRHLARVETDDPSTLAFLIDPEQEPVGQNGTAYQDRNSLIRWRYS